jgi:cysteine-rich repeat protein
VLIGGDDADDHGFFNGTNNVTGWLYIEKGFNNLGAAVTNGNAVAVCLGCNGCQAEAAFNSGFDLSNLPGAGWSRTNIVSTTDIADFFSGSGAVNVGNAGLIYLPTDEGNVCGGISSAQLGVINAAATTLASFVSSGGALFAHDEEFTTGGWGWLTALIPGITITDGGSCNVGDLTITPGGMSAFPGLTNADVDNATPWHEYFGGNLGGLDVLVTGTCATQQPVILGGVTVLSGQIDIDPKLALNPVGDSHTVTATVADANGDPLSGVTVSFEVTSGPNAGQTGSGTSDASGQASFTYTDSGGYGVDTIVASFVDPDTSQTQTSVGALKFWDADCNTNNSPDTCDLDCAGFGGLCGQRFPLTCGTSQDTDNNDVPDDCDNVSVCGNGMTESGEQCDDSNTDNGDCCSSTCQYEASGTSCEEDGNLCTLEQCDATGSCAFASTVVCTALDQCHVPGTCNPLDGVCDNPNKPDGFACSDGNECTQPDACSGGVCIGNPVGADSDADGYCDAWEIKVGCNPNDFRETPPQGSQSPGSAGPAPGQGLLFFAVPGNRRIHSSVDPSCATVGACGPTGFCTAGKISDPCTSASDCDEPPNTCRVVVNYAEVPSLTLPIATLNRKPVAGFTPITAGCARKVDVSIDPSRFWNRIFLKASGMIHGAMRYDRDRVTYMK